ncbi:unnamed protein product [Ambrosiozyma monospora]|uniref:Unnamed protein product n=1 Tax=Ambrosiozyma monospora TaxID=43982 RepID=A0ACB5TAM2_AMBMO|nr:unnamed protein product [Ambrosiozyma monospora]
MELPMCDVDYYINSKDPSDFKKNYKKTVDLNQIDFRNPSPYLLHDALAVIISCRTLEQIMDAISRDAMIPENVLKFDSQLNNFNNTDCLKPYSIVDSNVIVIDANLLLSKLINSLSALILHYSLSRELILIPLKTTTPQEANAENAGCMINQIPQQLPSPADVPTGISDSRIWRSIFLQLKASLEIVSLLELGEGVCQETLSANTIFKTTLGPCSVDLSDGWYSLDTHLSKKTNIPVTNETWIQYPTVTTSIVSQCVPLVCSLILIFAKFEYTVDAGSKTVRIIQKDKDGDIVDSTVVEHLDETIIKILTVTTASSSQLVNYMLEKVRLLNRYLNLMSNYYENVQTANGQVDQLIEHLLKVTN